MREKQNRMIILSTTVDFDLPDDSERLHGKYLIRINCLKGSKWAGHGF